MLKTPFHAVGSSTLARLLVAGAVFSAALVGGMVGLSGSPISAATTATASKSAAPAKANPAVAGLQQRLETEVQPLFQQFCYSCHGNGKAKGKFAMDKFKSATDVIAAPQHWEKVLQEIRDKNMPPEDEKQPTQQQLVTMMSWIDETLAAGHRTGVADPGRVTLRRLNRNEYDNTIRDLLFIEAKPARRFPVDDSGYGFDNIADVLSMSPLLAEKYIAAAEEVIDEAIGVTKPWEVDKVRYSGANLLAKGEKPQRSSRGEPKSIFQGKPAILKHQFPVEAEYDIRLRAKVEGDGKPGKVQVKVNWKDAGVHDVKASGPNQYTKRVKVPAGEQVIEVQIWKDDKAPGRKLVVYGLEIEGPFKAPPAPAPASRAKLFFVQPSAQLSHREAAKQIIQRFATRAYRRPVSTEELSRLLTLYDAAKKDPAASFEQAMKLPLTAVLVSPHFLFRIEGDDNADENGIRSLTDYELASRLSYFLWSSMPDDELFALAKKNELSKPEVLAKQVKRMLADPKASALTSNFAGQWLELRSLDDLSPDTEKFTTFDDALRFAMRREIELLFDTIVKEDRSILDIINADFTYVNEKLARHYGIDGVTGPDFQRVAVSGTPRGGVITSAAILTLTSNPTRTSPVKRGAWVLEQILGTPPPPPPPDAPQLEEGQQAEAKGTLRQRLTAHQDNPNCTICHRRMDPIGFALENFDGVGRWREKDGGFPIDASGVLPDGSQFDGAVGLKKLLMTRRDQVARATTERMLTYALGRGVEYYDRVAIDKVVAALGKNDYRFSTLVTEIVSSDPFRKRRIK